jgi:hypothetical protein
MVGMVVTDRPHMQLPRACKYMRSQYFKELYCEIKTFNYEYIQSGFRRIIRTDKAPAWSHNNHFRQRSTLPSSAAKFLLTDLGSCPQASSRTSPPFDGLP